MSNKGDALRARRRQKGYTQLKLSQLSGVDQVTISDIERGNTKSPSWEKVLALSAALDCAPQDLFTPPTEEPATTQGAVA